MGGTFAPKERAGPEPEPEMPPPHTVLRTAAWCAKLLLEYDGSAYFGWQRQPDGFSTVQGVLEAAVQRLTGEPAEQQCVRVAGRTDRVRCAQAAPA